MSEHLCRPPAGKDTTSPWTCTDPRCGAVWYRSTRLVDGALLTEWRNVRAVLEEAIRDAQFRALHASICHPPTVPAPCERCDRRISTETLCRLCWAGLWLSIKQDRANPPSYLRRNNYRTARDAA